MDCREQFVRNVVNDLLAKQIDIETIKQIEMVLISNTDNYDVSERCTELITEDKSIEGVIKMYLGTLLTEGKSLKTVDAYGRLLHFFIREINKSVFDMNTFDIRLWLAKRQSEVSLQTCENNRSYLSAFYRWLTAEGLIESNPMLKIKPIKYKDRLRLPYSAIELDALRTHCRNNRERAILEVLVSSGARISELCAMNQNDVNLGSLEVIIREGKGNKQRRTYISDVARCYLIKYMKERTDKDPCLFMTNAGTRISPSTVQAQLKRLGKRAKIENVHPHRCRRTFATNLCKRGMPLNNIQMLMGHSDINTTMRYISSEAELVRNDYMRFAS